MINHNMSDCYKCFVLFCRVYSNLSHCKSGIRCNIFCLAIIYFFCRSLDIIVLVRTLLYWLGDLFFAKLTPLLNKTKLPVVPDNYDLYYLIGLMLFFWLPPSSVVKKNNRNQSNNMRHNYPVQQIVIIGILVFYCFCFMLRLLLPPRE